MQQNFRNSVIYLYLERNPIMKSSLYAGVVALLLLSAIFYPVVSSSTTSEKIKVNVKFINMGGKEITAMVTKEEAKKLIAIVNHSMEKISNGDQGVFEILDEILMQLKEMNILKGVKEILNQLSHEYKLNKSDSPQPTGFFHSNLGSFVIGAGFGRDTYFIHRLPQILLLLPLLPILLLIPPIITYAFTTIVSKAIKINPITNFIVRAFLSRPKFTALLGEWYARRGAIASVGLLGTRFYIDLLNGVHVLLFGFVGISISLLGYAGIIIGFSPYSFIY